MTDTVPALRTDGPLFKDERTRELMQAFEVVVPCGNCGNDTWLLTVIAIAAEYEPVCERCLGVPSQRRRRWWPFG